MNIEIQNSSPSLTFGIKEPLSPLDLKDCDVFSSFEETFDTDYLRKFFKEQQDSTCSHSTQSPQKENSMNEETHSLTTAECESQISPPHRPTFNSTNDTIKNSRPEFSFNFSLNPKVFEIKRLAKACPPQLGPSGRSNSFSISQLSTGTSQASPLNLSNNIQLVMRKGSMTLSNTITQPILNQSCNNNLTDAFFQNNNYPNAGFQTEQIKILDQQQRENAKIEKLMKKKKVFRIIREQRPVLPKKTNMKRAASNPIEEEIFLPKVKHVKSHSKHSPANSGKPDFFTFNIPVDLTGTYFNFPNQLPTYQNQTNNQNMFLGQIGNQNQNQVQAQVPELDFFSKF